MFRVRVDIFCRCFKGRVLRTFLIIFKKSTVLMGSLFLHAFVYSSPSSFVEGPETPTSCGWMYVRRDAAGDKEEEDAELERLLPHHQRHPRGVVVEREEHLVLR